MTTTETIASLFRSMSSHLMRNGTCRFSDRASTSISIPEKCEPIFQHLRSVASAGLSPLGIYCSKPTVFVQRKVLRASVTSGSGTLDSASERRGGGEDDYDEEEDLVSRVDNLSLQTPVGMRMSNTTFNNQCINFTSAVSARICWASVFSTMSQNPSLYAKSFGLTSGGSMLNDLFFTHAVDSLDGKASSAIVTFTVLGIPVSPELIDQYTAEQMLMIPMRIPCAVDCPTQIELVQSTFARIMGRHHSDHDYIAMLLWGIGTTLAGDGLSTPKYSILPTQNPIVS